MLPRAQNMGRGHRFFIKVTQKFTVINSRKRVQTFLVCRNVSPRLSQVISSTFSCNFHEKSTAPARVFYVGSWTSTVQHCRHKKNRRFFVKVTGKFTIDNSRKTRSNISAQERLTLTSFFSSYQRYIFV